MATTIDRTRNSAWRPLLLVRAVMAAAAATMVAAPAHAAVPQFALNDTAGRTHTQAEWTPAKAVVLFFVGTDCPLSNSYVPEMNRLAGLYAARGVRVYGVLAEATLSAAAARRHAAAFGYAFPVLLDPGQLLVAHTGVTVTPEAAVLTADGIVHYHGRIDNRVEALGTRRARATQFDLREALDAVLDGRAVARPVTPAVGCFLAPAPVPASPPASLVTTATLTPTFNKDIAPILYEHCATCHRPGEVAPFPLLSYQDAARRARLLAKVTERRVMPPWKAQPGHGAFANERRLTDEEIARIGAWASTGAQEGDPKDKPPLPRFPDGWQAGTPDQVLTIGGTATVPADGPDLYRCFVVPTMLERDRYLAGAEFRPGNRLVVHHAIVFLDTTGRARKLAAGSADSSYACFGGPGFPPTGVIGGWAPGVTPPPPIPGASRTLPAGADLVVQLHYHPSGKPETDVSRLGLTFSGPPTRGVSGIIVGNRRIDIPPGDAHYVVTGAITVPRDVDVVGIAPHAHYLCKDMKVDARLPDGSVRPLIWIADWDFDWQGQYVYQTPIHLPAGTRIELTYTYDNSDANPRNPSSPPVRVRRGEQTTDEMALAFLKVVLPSPQDVPAFERAMKLEYLKALFSQFSARAGA